MKSISVLLVLSVVFCTNVGTLEASFQSNRELLFQAYFRENNEGYQEVCDLLQRNCTGRSKAAIKEYINNVDGELNFPVYYAARSGSIGVIGQLAGVLKDGDIGHELASVAAANISS